MMTRANKVDEDEEEEEEEEGEGDMSFDVPICVRMMVTSAHFT